MYTKKAYTSNEKNKTMNMAHDVNSPTTNKGQVASYTKAEILPK